MTRDTELDVVGIGHAIVDVLAQADDSFLARHGLDKGTMTLIDAGAATRLYDAMGPGVECSGGSAANTIAAIGSLGGRGAFVGKVGDDQLGEIFAHDIRAQGAAFGTPPDRNGAPTGRCLVLVTPDAKRTLQTNLGAAAALGPDDVDHRLVAAAKATYLEGYLWDAPRGREAFLRAAEIAHEEGRRIALSLSDPFCVARHRDDFLAFMRNHADVVFANEDEIVSLYREHSFDAALRRVRGDCSIAALTRSEKGSVVIAGEEAHVVEAEPARAVVDTTGAGDAYAAGFLFGLTRDMPLAACARIGGVAAAEVISHFGARAEVRLADLVREALG